MQKPDLASPPAPIAPLSYRPADAARALGISERTLWSWTKEQKIPHVRIGSVVLYPVVELERWLSTNVAGEGQVEAGAADRDSTENDVEK